MHRSATPQPGLLRAAFVAGAATAVAIALLDGFIARGVARLPAPVHRVAGAFVHVVELAFAFPLSPYLYGALAIATGLVLLLRGAHRESAHALLLVGLSHVTSRFLADILKPPFSRIRPYEAFDAGSWHDAWFAEVGNSFPSGHAVHFWGLFFPLAMLFPRQRLLLAILPILVAAARVLENDHYLGDVLASASLAALVTWGYAAALRPRGGDARGRARMAKEAP